MEHQYPAPITEDSEDQSRLAELMLPDQTHVRSQDWTMFFLHEDTNAEGDDPLPKEPRRRRTRARNDEADSVDGQDEDTDGSSDEEGDDEDGKAPPLMYVLNLVNTKQDHTVRR